MIFIVVIFFVIAAMLAVVSNQDIFSPSKLFLLFFLAFHAGALFSETSIWTETLIFLVLCVGVVAVIHEADRVHSFRALSQASPMTRHSIEPKDHTFFLWLASVPPLAAQYYMIDYFGGIAGYVNSLSFRVTEWAGLGWARTVIALLTPINLVYFALGLSQRRPLRWWGIYAIHFLTLLAIAVMSGSRSSLLNIFAIQIILFHYLRTPIRARQAVLLASGLVVAAMALGVVRENVRVSGDEIVASSDSGGKLSYASFYYGVDPLEIISNTEHMPLAHGTTFLSLVTNPVPRSIWPNKPDTGGAFFTKNYTNDAWEGFSNLTPTFIGEWVINFGWNTGILGFWLVYSVMIISVIQYYLRIMKRLARGVTDVSAVDLVIYVQVAWSVVALMTGEFTNVILGLILSQLIPLGLLRELLKRRTA